ncbi:MAG: QueT transporter family protein [Fastidiosipilaceae bacterium]
MKKTTYLTQGAIIAATYFALCMLIAPLAYGPLQFRLSEALMLLPALTPAAVPGLFVGCLLFNLLNPMALGPIDVIFGSLATLLAAMMTQRMGRFLQPPTSELTPKNLKLWLLPLPAVLLNGLIVGGYLLFLLPNTAVTPIAILGSVLSIAICEAVVIYAVGIPLTVTFLKSKQVRRQLRAGEDRWLTK